MGTINYNERSWAIDLISEINIWASKRNTHIKRAGGENTLKNNNGQLFPDVLLFGDEQRGRVLIGWELKMPDTPINDTGFFENAKKKAQLLSLNSFLLWNVSSAILYRIENDNSVTKIKEWDDLEYIKNRAEVERYSSEIRSTLHRMLDDLNAFIASNDIRSKSIVEVLSSEQVSNFIFRNLAGYAENLKTNAEVNKNLENEINLWWRYAKNDHPEETNKFIVLARINLIYLINKFLFAHVLKSFQKEAEVVNTIDSNANLNQILKIFHSLSEQIDFWNVFQTQTFEQYITPEVLRDLIEFNNFLKMFNFQMVDKTLLHDLMGFTIYRDKRKFAGQFATPQSLAKFIVNLAMTNKHGNVIDPCCGSGTISREVLQQKKSTVGIDTALKTTWASDKFSLPLQLATFNMLDPQAMGKILQVFKEDAIYLAPGKKIELHDPYDGGVVIKPLPKFSNIISNLPFVQQEDIELLNPEIKHINELIEMSLKTDGLDGRSDLYAYLPFYFWKLLEDNGTLTIIISNSWLNTHWGEIFIEKLSAFYDISTIITSGKGRWFNNAKVITNIVQLRKRNTPSTGNKVPTKFVVLRKEISNYSQTELSEIVALVSLKDAMHDNDVSIKTYTNKEMETYRQIGLSLNSLFTDNSWLIEIKDKLVNLSKLFTIGRGERRGWDEMFYPSNVEIEKEYLKPVLKTPRSIDKLIASPDAMAFCCSDSIESLQKNGKIKAFSWIKRFENLKNNSGVPLPTALRRPGIEWYTMLPNTTAEIVTNINFGDRLFFARFMEPTFVNQRLVRMSRLNNNVDIDLCHALLNSTIGLFFVEALGIGRGEGALDLSKDKIEKDFKILDPNQFNKEQRDEIVKKFEPLKVRNILGVEEELKQVDRDELDSAILSALGKIELKEKIKTSLLDLFRIRTTVNKKLN